MSEDYEVLYVLARNDLDSMNPGKLAAQVAHAATQLSEHMYSDSVDKDSALFVQYKNWTRQAFHFGTVITLAASKEQLLDFSDSQTGTYEHVAKDDTIDPTYPFVINKEFLDILMGRDILVSHVKIGDNKFAATRREHTCSWIFGMKSVVGKYVEGLDLYK